MSKNKKNKVKPAKVAMPKPNIDKITGIIYAIVAVIIAFVGIYVGTVMDYACNTNGKFVYDYVNAAMADVNRNFYRAQYASLLREGSYARKVSGYGLFAWFIFVVYKYSQDPRRTHRKGVEHGSAKWGDKKEMKTLNEDTTSDVIVMKKSDGNVLFDKDGEVLTAESETAVILSRDVKLSLKTWGHGLNLNTMVVGGSGSRKTRGFVLPNIMQMSTSYVVTDPKGEVLRASGKMLEQAGYKVRVLNLIELNHSHNYNPFHYVYDTEGNISEDNIKKMIDVLFQNTKGDGEKDDFWSKKGQTMLEALTYLLFEESEYNAVFDENGKIIPETRDISNLNFFALTEKLRKLQYPAKGNNAKPDGFFMERLPNEPEEDFRERQSKAFLCPLDKDFIELEKRKGETLAGRLYKEVRNAPQETGQSFLSSANVKTFFFNLTNLRNLTCCDNIHLETIGDEKTALFLLIPATSRTYNFVAAMLYSQMFEILNNRANFMYDGELPVHVRCIMDEFYNVGKIPNFDSIISFVRSMGISLNVVLQNMAQIKTMFEKEWESIMGNCSTFLFLGGNEQSTQKSVSEQLGKETIDVRSMNKTHSAKSPSTSESNSIMGRELMTESELKTMPVDDCVVMMQYHNPFYCNKFILDEHPNYKFLGLADPNNKYNVHDIYSVTTEEISKQYAKNKSDTKKEKVATGVNLDRELKPEVTDEPAKSNTEDAQRAKPVLNSAFKVIVEAPSEAEPVEIAGIPTSNDNEENDDIEISNDDISAVVFSGVDDDIEDHFSDNISDNTEVVDFSELPITPIKESDKAENVNPESEEIETVYDNEQNFSDILEEKEELEFDDNFEFASECLFSDVPFSSENVIVGGFE